MTAKNRRVFELRLGKVGLIVFISGMSVMLFSMFLLGIIVGKHMEAYPERYSSGITELIRDRLVRAVSKQEKVTVSAADQDKKDAPAGGGADFGLTFYDTLGGKKGGAAAGVPRPVRQNTNLPIFPPSKPRRREVPRKRDLRWRCTAGRGTKRPLRFPLVKGRERG